MERGTQQKRKVDICIVIVMFHFNYILELTLRVVCVAASAANVIGEWASRAFGLRWSLVTGTSGNNARIPRI